MHHKMCVSVVIADEVRQCRAQKSETILWGQEIHRNTLRLPQVSDAAGLCGCLSVNRLLFQPALLQK